MRRIRAKIVQSAGFRYAFLLFFYLILPLKLKGQTFYPPLDTQLRITGNFGELRSAHFHTGCDFSTGGKEGRQVLAMDTGEIVRIKVSQTGFGKVLYLNHPGGITSVYAHLHSFSPELEELMDSIQQSQESWEVEFFPKGQQFKVSAGQVIGLSGNTGGSEAPHLHFEIRDTRSEKALNPLNYLKLKARATLSKITWHVYRRENDRWTHFLESKQPQIKLAPGVYGLGAEIAYADSVYQLGIQSVEMRDTTDSLRFQLQLDSLRFDENRFAQAVMDADLFVKEGRKVYRLFTLPCAKFSQTRTEDQSYLQLSSEPLILSICISADQQPDSCFRVELVPDKSQSAPAIPLSGWSVPCSSDTLFESADIQLEIPSGAFYDLTEIDFKASVIDKSNGRFCLSFKGALHKALRLKMNKPRNYAPSQLLFIEQGERLRYAAKPVEIKNALHFELRKEGCYRLAFDSLPPRLISVRPFVDPVNRQSGIQVFFTDDQSGLSSHRVTLNNFFIPTERRGLGSSLTIRRPVDFCGPSQLKIVVVDHGGNSSEWEWMY